MKHNSILSKAVRRLLPAIIAIAATGPALAQGIVVNTKDGRSIDYPAGLFSAMTPYIFSQSSTTLTQGVVATLEYEKAADMNTGRADHQTFASGDALVVVGGHTSNFVPTASAELWQDGKWTSVSISNEHDAGFSVTLADGRVLVGGGYSERGGTGGSTKTDIFNPATQTFSQGPLMTTPRSNCKAIATSRGVYVHGNRGGTDATYDFYNGSTFAGTGNPDGRYRPYLFTDAQGNIYPLSTTDNNLNTIALRKSSSGVECLYGEKYDVAANKDYYYFYNAYTTYMPLTLPADIRSEQYNRRDRNGFMVLAKNAAGDYLLTEPCADQSTTYNYTRFDIPSRHPVSNELIEWRGGVYVNNDKGEAYLIGSSQSGGNYTLHIISLNYKEYYWTIASAGGFSYDLATASFTLLSDGRMACSGGYSGTTAQKSVYLFTLPKAGAESSSAEKQFGIDINKTDGTSDRYMESELKNVTTYQPDEKPGGHQATTTVAPTGGKVNLENLTIDLPAGTFNTDTKVTISETEEGYIDGDDELSEYYKVHFTAGVRKDFKVSITMPRLANDDNVRLQFATMGWAPSLRQEMLTYHYIDVTYENGAYVAEIPAMDAPDDAANQEVYVGITRCHAVDVAAARAQAGTESQNNYNVYNKAGNDGDILKMLSNIKEWVPASIAKLESLNYSKDKGSVINCYLLAEPGLLLKLKGGAEAAGWFSFSTWSKSWGVVYFNNAIMSKKEDDENRATTIHELFHYYQQFYDPRSSARLCYSPKSTPLILEEASSVWSEKFYTPLPENTKGYITAFVPSLEPEHRGILDCTNAQYEWSARFANVGYGASALLEYLSHKCGDKIVHDMWEERKTGDPFDTKGIIERAAQKYHIDIFTQEEYKNFIEMLGCGNLYQSKLSFDEIVNIRQEHDSVGITQRDVMSRWPIYLTNYVYGYGALVEKIKVRNTYDGNSDIRHSLDNVKGVINQTTEGVTTWLYRAADNGQFFLCGSAKKGSPLIISNEWLRKLKKGSDGEEVYPQTDFYTVTIADDFKTTTDILSRTVVQLVKLEVPQKSIMVPSSPGTENVRLATNCYNLTFKTDADWLTCYHSFIDSTLNVRHEVMPDNMKERKATIQIILQSDNGTDVVMDEIEVTQTRAYINLSETKFNVKKEGETKTVSITSTNCTGLQVSTTSQFLHPTLSGSTITVKVDPNTSYERREGSVKVSGTMPETGIMVERFVSFSQEAAPSPDEIDLYSNGSVTVEGLRLPIPGKTMKSGDYLLYRSADTQIERNDNYRKEYSWDVKLYIDPKDNKSMRHYELYSGSVSWLENRYWTDPDNGKETLRTTRCSYNLKNLKTTDGLTFKSWIYGQDNEQYTVGDFVTDYSYQETLDGTPVNTVTQADIASRPITSNSAMVALSLADGVPYLEADRDSMTFNGNENFEYFWYSINDVVTDVKVTASHDWMTLEKISTSAYNGHYSLTVGVNHSKAPREGQVYLTGTLADGSQVTRTIIVTQSYEAMWEDDWTEFEDQKAELPSQAVLNALQQAGTPLYLGSTPPRLNGVYKMEPLHTIYSTYEDSGEEDYAQSLVLRLSSSASAADKAMMSYYTQLKTGQSTSASDYYCYLSGDGQNFTLSNITHGGYEDLFSYTIVTVISGTIEDGNISNLHLASVELDDDGNIEELSIGADGDGISTPTTWEPGDDVDWSRSVKKKVLRGQSGCRL